MTDHLTDLPARPVPAPAPVAPGTPAGDTPTIAVRHVQAVLADRIVEDATVVAEDGIITSVVEGGAAPSGALDGRGALCLPGIVDTHSDGLEKEIRPRPGVPFPLDFALASFEGRVRAAGVTTMFHGIAFEHNDDETRTVDLAGRLCDEIGARAASAPLVDHRLLHRLDARDPAGFDALRHRLGAHPHASPSTMPPQTTPASASSSMQPPADDPPPLVSFEDHTPGQGQYADTAYFRAYLENARGMTSAEAHAAVDELRTARDARLAQRDTAIAWLAARARAGTVRLIAHDPATPDEIDQALGWGVSIAEFPTSVAAASAARAAGLAVVMGAPNVLRGGSHSGNVAAEQVVAQGSCTALASDYLPSTLLAAAVRLAARRTVPLWQAVALVTSGPADAAGLSDRGRLAPGQRADLVLATVHGDWPTVRSVLRGADATGVPQVVMC